MSIGEEDVLDTATFLSIESSKVAHDDNFISLAKFIT
jgi:hypothetical protein